MSAKPRKHYHHGNTPAAVWGSVISFVGFLVATVGFFMAPINWVVIGIGGAIVALALVVALALRSLGYGQ